MISFLNFFYKIIYKVRKLRLFASIKVGFYVLLNNISKYPSYVLKFENLVSKKFNSNYALTFSSGTAAFYSAILSLDLAKNSNVLVSRVTFPSVITVLKFLGFNLYYFDTDKQFQPKYKNDLLELKYSLIVITHPFGFIINPDSYKNFIADDTKLIYDCSHIHGAKYKGKYPNEFADISFMSLQGQKAISGGEGGIILTNSENYYKKMIELNHPGHSRNNYFKEFTGMSKNIKLRMHPISALVAIEDLKKIELENNLLRVKIRKIYNFLSKKNNIELNKFDLDNSGGFHYGIPIYFKDIKKQNIEWPLLEYNWPINYDEINFPLKNKIDDNYKNLFFVDLNWIKNNSFFYIKSKLDFIIK